MLKAEELTELPPVAQNIYLKCKKTCDRDAAYHKIVAHKTERSAKVECEVCGAKRSFTIKKKSTSTRKPKDGPKIPSWAELQDNNSIDFGNPLPYKMTGSFEVNAALDHSKFGLGVVVDVGANKIEVVFELGAKTLVHNRP